jgi:hypothetical protein
MLEIGSENSFGEFKDEGEGVEETMLMSIIWSTNIVMKLGKKRMSHTTQAHGFYKEK